MLQELSQAFSLEPSGENAQRLILSSAVSINQVRSLRDLAQGIVDEQGDLTVDCAAVERLDSSICQLLLVLQEELVSQRRSMTLANVSEELNESLTVIGLQDAFAIS